MGQEVGDVPVVQNPADNADQIALSQQIQAQAQERAKPAPETASERMWEVTKEGVTLIPQGFVNSLNPDHILPNVAMGFAIGAATRAILPAGGPVAKVAGVAMAGYFLGKPLYETYSGAYHATTMGEMHDAAGLLGNTLGGLPVGMVEGAVGAKIGSSLVGRAMATKTAMPLVEWKANQYAKLDMHIDNGVAGMRNLAFTKFGIGGPVMKANSVNGIVPGYMLEELARRDPGNPAYPETIQKLNALANNRGQFGERAAAIDHKGAREVYDAQFKEQPGKLVRSEGGKKTGDPEVDNIYDYTGEVRAFYSEVHGRNSVDGKGMKMKSTVNYGDNFENAYWDGTGMYYGKPGPQSPFSNFTKRDITGHEITHGVTEHVSNIVYRGQPGALNESISDVFGALVVQKVLGQTAKEATWLVGEGIWKPEMNSKALRDMRNPGTAYDHPTIGKDPQPAHMNDFIRTRSDNGGVHLNSGIPNRAFVLAADAIGGFAWEAPGKIWYQARANAGSQPSFAQFAHHTIEAAKQLGYEQHVPKLQKAWNDVGITPSAIDKGGLTPVMPDNWFDRKTTIGSH